MSDPILTIPFPSGLSKVSRNDPKNEGTSARGQGKATTVGKWSSERCFQDQGPIFSAMCADIDTAQVSVDFENFIFEDDALGQSVLQSLMRARRRGVKVRLLLDGIGSAEFPHSTADTLRTEGVSVRIYHPWRSFFKRLGLQLLTLHVVGFFREISQMNRRSHRKTCLVDGNIAWVGSANVTLRHSAWRETTARVTGGELSVIARSFDWMWDRARADVQSIGRKAPENGRAVFISYGSRTARTRNRARRDLIKTARTRVRVISPYFIPPFPLLLALIQAQKRRGVLVEILVPARSDFPIVQWFSRAAYRILLRAGVRIYLYDAGMIHSKVLIVDDRAIVGSSNFNFRSVLHDLEIDILLERPETLRALEDQWERDVERSHRLTRADADREPWLEGLVVRLFARARRLL